MDTVAANHDQEYGTVEYYAAAIRRHARTCPADIPWLAITLIECCVDPDAWVPEGAGERVERVRNALAAAEIVRVELAAGR